MTLSLLGVRFCPIPPALGFRRSSSSSGSMSKPKTRFSSKQDSLPGSESCLRVSGRTKRVKRTVECQEKEHEAESHDRKQCGLPDIEEFAYKRGNGSFQSRKSVPTSDVLSVETEVASAIRPRVTVKSGEPPPNWEKVLEGIRKMRSLEDAPVDTMGCEKAGSSLPPKITLKHTHGQSSSEELCFWRIEDAMKTTSMPLDYQLMRKNEESESTQLLVLVKTSQEVKKLS